MYRTSTCEGEASRNDVAPLFAAVYPPDVLATVPWRNIQSSRSETRILIYDKDDCLVATAGLIPRKALHDGRPVVICGIGGVATLPSRQRTGFGRAAMLEAQKTAVCQYNADFALLFCEPKNVPFYMKLEWAVFNGTVLAEQSGQKRAYDIMVSMVRPSMGAGPSAGTIDICGLPW